VKTIEDNIEALFSLIPVIRKIISKYAPPVPPSTSPSGESLQDQHSLQDDDESRRPPRSKKEPTSKKSFAPGSGSGKSKKGNVDAVFSEEWEPRKSGNLPKQIP
jgi:hypothetical protein